MCVCAPLMLSVSVVAPTFQPVSLEAVRTRDELVTSVRTPASVCARRIREHTLIETKIMCGPRASLPKEEKAKREWPVHFSYLRLSVLE